MAYVISHLVASQSQTISSTKMRPSKTLNSPPSLSSSSILPGDLPLQEILPLEIMEEILSRLQVKPLLQLRCVCKSWHSLISNPKFAKKHLTQSSTNYTRCRLIFNPPRILQVLRMFIPLISPSRVVAVDANFLDQHLNNPYYDSIVVGSCDGILCITVNQRHIFLWNPSIKKSKKLPTLEGPSQEPGYITDLSFIVYGLGYDHIVDRYKVVAVFRYTREAHVHTLGIESWRRIEDFPYIVGDDQGKFVSGTLNWLKGGSSKIIVSFDLVKECCQELSQPDYGGDVTVNLGVLRDCLCIYSNSSTFSEVWVMNEYGNQESWTKLFRVPDSFTLGTRVLYAYENNEVLLNFNSCVLIYNYTNGVTRSPDTECSIKVSSGMIPHGYIESLISPCL